jgi:polysaccharide deacetylase 2 family uncharacterized protein YibQ
VLGYVYAVSHGWRVPGAAAPHDVDESPTVSRPAEPSGKTPAKELSKGRQDAPRRQDPKAPTALSDFEPAGGSSHGILAIVMDDLGFEDGSLERLSRLEGPLALAILPGAPRAVEAAGLARRKGWDILVHLPMASEAGPAEAESIGPSDDDQTIVERVSRAVAHVPGATGLNNHQGSLATADSRVMRSILRVVRDRGLFFLDSKTTAGSVAEREARALGISTVARDVFLDDATAESLSKGGPGEALASAWEKALKMSSSKGSCVLIGHPHPLTLDFLAAHLSELSRSRIKRVKVSELAD